MTVKELKQKLENYPDNMDVFLCGGKTEFEYGLLNSVTKKEITFHDFSNNKDVEALVNVIVLDEE